MFQLFGSTKSFLFLFFIAVLTSCVTVRNYPVDKPFVFANKINLTGQVSKDEQKRLKTELETYWDDSLIVNSISQFGIKTIIKNPSVFDSSAVTRSITFMSSYLNAQGYYYPEIAAEPVKLDSTHEKQIRATVVIDINVNKNIIIDSVSYDSIVTPELHQLAIDNIKQSSIGKNKPFSKGVMASELDRLVNLFRSNGYYRFTRENLYVEADTSDISLLDITIDPIQQAQRIAAAQERRRQNPTVHVLFKQRESADSNATKKFYVGNITYYPFVRFENFDSLLNATLPYTTTSREFTMKQSRPFIKMRPLREHTYLKEGTVYNEQNFFRTVNAFSQMGPWSQVDERIVMKKDSVNKLDFNFFLTPASKYSFGYDLEVSRNTGSIIAGNLLGITNAFTLRDRNAFKQGIQSSTNIRGGVELGFSDTVLQTFQASISQTYSIPRFITPWRNKRLKRLDDYKTVVNFNASYTDRRNFFRLRSAVTSFGYEWRKNKHVWLVRPINVELYSLDTLPELTKAFVTNPFLRTAFNTGYVAGENATYSLTFSDRNKSTNVNSLRLSAEESGAIMARFKGLRNSIYQYIKLEGEIRRVMQYRKTSLAMRFFGGVGYNYSNDPIIGQSLPFFKQYVAGGPYSMRAWGVRQLGLGSSLLSDTSTVFRDRFGDIQLEANFEYRFPLATISGVKINSAFFTDIGNIWNLKNNVNNPGSKLELNKLFHDLAIAGGTGLRFDFNYFLIRFDFAYKVKDPARRANGGWMSIRDFEWRNHEFDIRDASGRALNRNNFAFQLGIGLPF